MGFEWDVGQRGLDGPSSNSGHTHCWVAMESFNKSKVHRRASPQACTRSHTLDDSSSSSGRSSDSVNSRKWNDNDGIGRYKKWRATSKSGDSFRKDVRHSRQRAKLGGVTVGEVHQNTSEKDESSSNSSSSSDESSSSNEEVEALKVRQQDQRISQSEKLTSLKRKKPGDKGCVNMEFCSNHGKFHALSSVTNHQCVMLSSYIKIPSCILNQPKQTSAMKKLQKTLPRHHN